MSPDSNVLLLAKEYDHGSRFSFPETSYTSDFKWKMNTDFIKSCVARRLPNGHNPHPRDAKFITWIQDFKVCNISTYDRPISGYSYRPRAKRELITTSALSYRPPPKESYRAKSAGSVDQESALQSSGVRCALSTWSQPSKPFPADMNYKIKTNKGVSMEVDRQKRERLLQRAAKDTAFKPKVSVQKSMTREEVQKLKETRLEKERLFEQNRYRNELKKQMERSRYDFSLIPFVYRNTEVSYPHQKAMLNHRIKSAAPGLVR